jgi:hypothetical protein
MAATIMDQLREELARSKDTAPTRFGAWTVHNKALASDKGAGLQAGQKATPGEGINPYYTGPFSLFGVLGLDSDIISTRVQPRGLSGALPAQPSNEMNPFFGYFTGFLPDQAVAESGTPCADPPMAGSGKTCVQTAQYGRYERMTRTADITRLGQRINNGDTGFDLRIINDPLLQRGAAGGDIITPNVNGGPAPAAEMLMRMMEVGQSLQLLLSRQVFRGNPANNLDGGYQEFPGLDILIGTNKVDAFTGATCTALGSILENFSYQRVDSNGVNIVMAITYIARRIRFLAERQGLDPVTWCIAMRQEAFYEISAVWPCAYLTSRCTNVQVPSAAVGTANVVLNVEGADQKRMTDEMRNGRYLIIDGEQWPVVFDDGITEYTSANQGQLADGCFSSDIYFIPVTFMGGQAGTYFQYMDWTGRFAAMSEVADAGFGQGYYQSDGGRFLWHFKPPNNYCIQMLALIMLRLVLRVPQLAARLQNVAYCPVAHTAEPYPDDPYFRNGGVSVNRSLPGLYSDWNLTGAQPSGTGV